MSNPQFKNVPAVYAACKFLCPIALILVWGAALFKRDDDAVGGAIATLIIVALLYICMVGIKIGLPEHRSAFHWGILVFASLTIWLTYSILVH